MMGATYPDTDILIDPIAEARRAVARAQSEDIVLRLIGGVGVRLQSPQQPLLDREIRDIDFVTPRGGKQALASLFESLGYVSDEQFNAFHGHDRQIYVDVANRRKVDVFVGGFSMCHAIPVTERLDREEYTVPLAELLLTKLQIVELNERDERDIYNLCFHHDVVDGQGEGIEGALIAELLARDWGLWRTTKGTIERCLADLGNYGLASEHRDLIASRLGQLWDRIEREPKTSKWRMRNRIGDRVRWYEEPEEEAQQQ